MKCRRKISRRAWLGTTLSTVAALPLVGQRAAAEAVVGQSAERGSFALDGNRVRLFSSSAQEKLTFLVAGDTHLFLDDERGAPFTQYSGRMAKAYNQTRHFKTGAATNPQECFQQTLAEAKKRHADLLVLVGDIFSFPSEAAIEWAHQELQDSGVPFLYVAGNHDWHYEGMAGPEVALRAEWTTKRLLPLYQGHNPLMTSVEKKGVRLVTIDNSTNEVLPEQLEFWRTQVASGAPLVLLMHIPLYAQGRSIDFGCGHPQWGAQSDKVWEIERRPKWPEAGHNATTLAFRREVFAAPNLLGVFAGHLHRQSLDCVDGVPQFVTEANATGGYLDVEIGGKLHG